ncbi:hypothetical protein LTR40_014771, partial [Exophiala xenobiotica]
KQEQEFLKSSTPISFDFSSQQSPPDLKSSASMDNPGAILASTVTSTAALGFVPVAIYFNLFQLLNKIGPVATASALTHASDEERTEEERTRAPLCKERVMHKLISY